MSKAVICDGCGYTYNNCEELKTVIMVDKSTRNDPNNIVRYDLCPGEGLSFSMEFEACHTLNESKTNFMVEPMEEQDG